MPTWLRSVGRILAGGVLTIALATVAWAQTGFIGGPREPAQDGSLGQASMAADATGGQDLAESILIQREADAGRALDVRYRALLKAQLAALSTKRLESLQSAGPLANLREALTPNALGDSSSDLVYTPVTPCRVFDTRSATAGILVGGTQRNFIVAGTTDFTDQGGNDGGCGIPFGPATSVIINFAAVTPTGPGNLRAWAVAEPQPDAPTAAVVNFSPVLPALANGIAVPICDLAASSCSSDLRLQADVSSVHVVGDVVGYFRSTGQVLPGGNLPSGSTLRGVWGLGWTAGAADEFHEMSLSFVFTLPYDPVPHFIAWGTTPPAGCPGTSTDPQANPGQLCVYEEQTLNTWGTNVFATRLGVWVLTNSAGAGRVWMSGTWAVTAP